MLIWMNDRLVAQEDAHVSVFNHGLIVGDGVFETVKVVDGAPFALNRHIARLQKSAATLGLPAPSADDVAKASAEVATQVPSGLGRMRITYTGGAGPMGSDRTSGEPTLIVAAVPVDNPYGPTAAVAVVPWLRNEQGALTGAKTTSYGENVVALDRAKSIGANEALFADTQGRLSEGTGSNVFVVVGGELLTPSLDAGCLAGITRALLLEWTDAREADLPLSVLETADEVFLTSSTRDVQAVDTVVFADGRRRELGAPGPVTARAAEIFAAKSTANAEP